MKDLIEVLKQLQGTYSGSGINHENQKFVGKMQLDPIVCGAGLQIKFEAKGLDEEIYHTELSTIATDFNKKIKMWNLNSNTPAMTELALEESTDTKAIFRYGNITENETFREEIHIEVIDKKISYDYHWGLPGGEFRLRSGVKMSRTI